MISHIRLGYISWKGKIIFSVSSTNINPWSRTKPIGISRLYGQIMAESSLRKNSRNSIESLGLRGSWALHTILNKMALRNERTNHNGSSEINATWPGYSNAPLGKSSKDSCVCTELYSSLSTWQRDSWRGFLRRETKIQPSQNIWLPRIHTHPKGK